MPEHSPLPWRQDNTDVVPNQVRTEDGELIADCYTCRANAAYIVTAANAFPELVDSLSNIVAEAMDTYNDPDDMSPTWKRLIDAAQLALKNAGVTDATT